MRHHVAATHGSYEQGGYCNSGFAAFSRLNRDINYLLYFLLFYGTCRSCMWHRMHRGQSCIPSCKNMQYDRTAQWYTALATTSETTTSSQFWLTRWGRVEDHRICHLSLVTTCHHCIHWHHRMNCCLAIFTLPSSSLTKHFLLVLENCAMNRLLAVVLHLV